MRCLPTRINRSLVGRYDRNAHDTLPSYRRSVPLSAATFTCTVAANSFVSFASSCSPATESRLNVPSSSMKRWYLYGWFETA